MFYFFQSWFIFLNLNTCSIFQVNGTLVTNSNHIEVVRLIKGKEKVDGSRWSEGRKQRNIPRLPFSNSSTEWCTCKMLWGCISINVLIIGIMNYSATWFSCNKRVQIALVLELLSCLLLYLYNYEFFGVRKNFFGFSK